MAESRDGGLLEPDEHRRLQRALHLDLQQARHLMVPRRRISAIDVNTPLQDVVPLVAQSPYSRLPVYRDSIDNVVGMLHTKDLVRVLVSDGGATTVASVMRPIPTIPETLSAGRVLRTLRDRRSHQAIVVDEFGGTSGLLTLEDLLTELLGEVGDEFKAAEPTAERLADGRVRLPGRMPVHDAAAILDADWDTDATTVGGFVVEGLGHLPAAGETITIGEHELEIERVADHAVESVIARKVAPDAPEAGE
jgi:CBS domain containing-hemolysin-like protein